ncbi:MAG: hypothetical protein GF320_02375 [Armatimonadia bacterium]|nr:hypothetical protein [Armatimonadia bacterium]
MRLTMALLAIIVASTGAHARTFTFEGGPGGSPETPYRFVMTGDPGDRQYEVVSSAGAAFPVQAETLGRQTWGYFIVPALDPGATLELNLRQTGRKWTPEVQVHEVDGAVQVDIRGELFTRYVTEDTPKPYCYPVIGPTGAPVTRNYPMVPGVEGEAEDHPHHMSLYFGHGEVNHRDFWAIGDDRGRTVHREFVDLVSGPVFGSLTAVTDWVDQEGVTVCNDIRTIRFYATRGARVMDYEVTVRADDGPVHFGDTKEGMMSFRVAGSMKVDSGGTIINSEGQTNADAWGKKARWCDNYGPLEGETVGIAILDAPVNLRHPTTWHVRNYGLFGANPFGLKYYLGDAAPDGTLDLAEGEEIPFRYRFVIHEGTAEEAQIDERWEYYARGFDDPAFR